MRPALLALAGAALVGAALWLVWPQDDVPPAANTAHATASTPAPVAGRPWLDAWPPAGQGAPAAQAPLAAAHSMAQTRAYGDPEAPPIAVDVPARARPTAEELADPKAYQAFEARQNAQVMAAYVKAVDEELPRLREDIARGRSMGIAADKIAKAEEKARGLESMRAQLLKDHPAIGK
ncbi:hypothetical protein [Massilia antarctica]|uniref:hypothetical protein n=1 Tax=Massilia antarctica TaxID=2765360 RepID=UPI0006BB9222|nr:hypothetical protein [Massilia sp. H27-R4]MCY0915389.1 hypothetical protein [Massilia sp. H27-R4]CUI05851.1 hypothetical protein BN2497_6479 [Janthinobacterium sp. CG23_2]CUU29637.1 hypothetical protein BN3177_6479 [Janthinobacterium sp. CG23_2]